MELTVGGGTPIVEPSAAQIADALVSLTGEGDSFAILAESDLTYIQTSGAASEGFVLEYQEGSVEQHYRSVSHDLPLHTVTQAFQLYAVADPEWRNVTSWGRDDAVAGRISLGPLAIGAAVLVGLVFLWLRAA